jgi:hypothetical protein
MSIEPRTEHEYGDLASWRREQLLRSGFSPHAARRLAADPRYDLHVLIELTERGCTPEVAARIVAPLEDDLAA